MVVRMASSTDKAFRSKGAVVNRQATKEMDVRKTLFDTEGMDAFLDWITVVGHYRQAQHRLVHSHRNVARYIASKHGTRWDPEMVKSALKFVKERYYQAREILTSTDNGGNTETDATLRDKVLTVCPPFEKLDTVFGTPSESLHLPPAQSLPPQPGESSNSRALLSPDMVDLDDISDTDYDDHPSESKTQSHPPRRSKRQNTEKTAVATSSEGGVMTKQDSKERVVWKGGLLNTEGIDMLVDWIRDAGNFEPSTIERSIFRQKKLVDSHRDIARYITSKHGTKWNRQMVGTALHRLRKMYDQAREILTSAGEGGDIETDTLLRDKVLTVCPLFEKLDTVFGTSVEGLHIPPVQTLPLHPREPSNSRALLSPDTADIDDITEVDHDNHPSENETPSHPPRRSKRQKMEKTVVAESSRSTVVNKHASKRDHLKTFFITKGMDVFLNWITDAGNYEPSTSRRTIFGDKRLVHSYGDIAKHINSIHGTNWDQQTVSNRLYRLKAKYDQAKEILTIANGGKNTEDTKLRYRVLAVCPPFEKLRNVFGTPFERLHLPPEQTLPPQHGEPAESRTPLSPSIMDQNRSDDMDSDGQPTEDETATHSSRGSKRRKTEKTAVATSQDHIRQTTQASDRQHIPMDDVIGDIRRRQEVLEAREKDLTDRLLEAERKHHEMLIKREEQHREMLMKMEEQHRERLKRRERHQRKSLKKREEEYGGQWERRLRNLEDEKTELKEEKAELKEEKAELKREKVELKEEKAELKEERALFKKERDGMLQDMAAMKRELELRTTCSHRH